MRLWAYVIAFALLAGTIGYGIHIVRKASRVDAAEARAEAAEQRASDVAVRFLKAAESDRATATELAGLRAQIADNALTFANAIKAKPIVREIQHVENGQSVTCHERDPARYLELFNAAVEGSAPPGS